MSSKKYDEEDGVWRTIGGKRIFIQKGESLSDAMKKSGKFPTQKKKEFKNNETKEETKVDIEKEYKQRISTARTQKELEEADKYYEEKTGINPGNELERKMKQDREEYEYGSSKEKFNDLVDAVNEINKKNINNLEISDKEKEKLYDENDKKIEKYKKNISDGDTKYIKEHIEKRELKYLLIKNPYADDNFVYEETYKIYKKKHPESEMNFERFKTMMRSYLK